MARKVIAVEGKHFGELSYLEPDSVKWPEDPIPVIWNFNFDDPRNIMGVAEDFRRDEDGLITCEIKLNDQALPLENDFGGYTFYANQVKQHLETDVEDEDKHYHVDTCLIRAVSAVIHIPWGLVI